MFPGPLLILVFFGFGAFWAFGPDWSWLPFNVLFWLLVVISIAAGPARMAIMYPITAQSVSSTFSLTLFLSIAVAVALTLHGRYWELLLCGAVFLVSGLLWPRLRSVGPI